MSGATDPNHAEYKAFADLVARNWSTGEETDAENRAVDAYVAEAASAMTDGQL